MTVLEKVAEAPGASSATDGDIVQRRTVPVGPTRLALSNGIRAVRAPGLVIVPETSRTWLPDGSAVATPATVIFNAGPDGSRFASVSPTTGIRARSPGASIRPTHRPVAVTARAKPRMIATKVRTGCERDSLSSGSSPSSALESMAVPGSAASTGSSASVIGGGNGAIAASGADCSGAGAAIAGLSPGSACTSATQRCSQTAHFSRAPLATTSGDSRYRAPQLGQVTITATI